MPTQNGSMSGSPRQLNQLGRPAIDVFMNNTTRCRVWSSWQSGDRIYTIGKIKLGCCMIHHRNFHSGTVEITRGSLRTNRPSCNKKKDEPTCERSESRLPEGKTGLRLEKRSQKDFEKIIERNLYFRHIRDVNINKQYNIENLSTIFLYYILLQLPMTDLFTIRLLAKE
uniref:Uncharacterized protein n=1 Tax=Romanomermis culicivorax TaxID=13658 RepID=A0A915HKC2_ROMCU